MLSALCYLVSAVCCLLSGAQGLLPGACSLVLKDQPPPCPQPISWIAPLTFQSIFCVCFGACFWASLGAFWVPFGIHFGLTFEMFWRPFSHRSSERLRVLIFVALGLLLGSVFDSKIDPGSSQEQKGPPSILNNPPRKINGFSLGGCPGGPKTPPGNVTKKQHDF